MPELEIGWSRNGRSYDGGVVADRLVCGDATLAVTLLANVVRTHTDNLGHLYSARYASQIRRRMERDLEAFLNNSEPTRARITVGAVTFWIKPNVRRRIRQDDSVRSRAALTGWEPADLYRLASRQRSQTLQRNQTIEYQNYQAEAAAGN